MVAGGRVSERPHAGAVSLAVIRAMVDDADAHGYGPNHRDAARALAVFGDPRQTEPETVEHAGQPVTILPCVSALAVREALLNHDDAGWLVIITDRTEDDLGAGVLAHLAGHKLRTPDPWRAVQQQFAATGIEPALYAQPGSRSLAQGLLAARTEDGWPPAPAGALTRDHALGAVARARLGVRPRSLDPLGVLRWASDPAVPGLIADLRQTAGDEIVDATIDWICAGAGSAAEPLRALVRAGDLGDAVPLGLVVAVLAGATGGETQQAQLGLARLAHRWGGGDLSAATLTTWGAAATTAASEMIADRESADLTRRLLARGDQLLTEAGAAGLAARSDVLPAGLTARLQDLAHRLRQAAGGDTTVDIESALGTVQTHHLADETTPPLISVLAAVRLVRWLRSSRETGGSLAALAQRQSAVDSWVDAAVNDAYAGAADPVVAEALGEVLSAVRTVRDAHDAEFATALAAATAAEEGTDVGYLEVDGQRVWLLEHVMRGVVIPLAQQHRTLLLVLDGMSTAVATEVLEDIRTSRGTWTEALLPGARERACALAVLPSLTEVSRASLLTGTLSTGGQDHERKGHTALTKPFGIKSVLFHKKPLDSSRAGFAVADDVAAAIADEETHLVTCVLNTIDDALDRSDPAGTTWTADAIKHLRALLDQALVAGRTVVLTADHGHVVERREGAQRSHPDFSSARSRSATPPAGEGEVLVSGPRVLLHGGQAVLAVDERLRYGPLKAGYHGGASPAEVVVPLVVLSPGVPQGELRPAPAQAPTWWWQAPDDSAPDTATVLPAALPTGPPTLFDDILPTEEAGQPSRVSTAVLRSETYAAQQAAAPRVALTDDQVAAVLDALAAAPGTRMPLSALAGILAVPAARIRGAVAQLQQLLNVEGYPVLRIDGPLVVLDEPLLREQFEVR